MHDQFSRTRLLLGDDALDTLRHAHVAVFGIGGVGGYAAEALARSGVGALSIIDKDTVCVTNINRQVIATVDVVGQDKVAVMEERVSRINPQCRVTARKCFYLPTTAGEFDFGEYDYIVDAVDTVTAKLLLVQEAQRCGTPIISSMGAANKLDPLAFEVADIYETEVCPLARIMRKECRKRGIEHLKVVYSKEPARKPLSSSDVECAYRDACPPSELQHCGDASDAPGSVPFVPPVVGLVIASEVVKDLLARA